MPRASQSQDHVIEALRALEFTESQASVYAALLRLRRCSVRDLVGATTLSRITIQTILQKFESEQLVCGVYEGKKRRVFSVANVRRVQSLLDGRISKLERQREEVARIFADATRLSRGGPQGFGVHALRGLKGLDILRDDIADCNEELSICSDMSALSARDYTSLSAAYLPALLESHIPVRFILCETPKARRFVKHLVQLGLMGRVKNRFIPVRGTRLTVAIAVYGDRVALINQAALTVVLIRDKVISDLFRMWTTQLWKGTWKL